MSFDHPTEDFVPVKDFDGYEVSNLGRVRSCLMRPAPGCSGRKSDSWHIIKRQHGPGGYLSVVLHRDCKQFPKYVHELVALAFIGERPSDGEIRHLDGDKTNPMAWNLAWGTHTDNEKDKIQHDTNPIGSRHPSAILSEDQVKEIRRLSSIGIPTIEIAKQYKIRYNHAYGIVKQITWKHVI